MATSTATIDTRIERHSVSDSVSGISIDDTGDQLVISGLNIPPEQIQSLENVLAIWKYGLVEDSND